MLPILLTILAIATWVIKILLVIYAFTIPAKIKRYFWYQQKHLEIQAAMARKAGVTEDELNEILDGAVD